MTRLQRKFLRKIAPPFVIMGYIAMVLMLFVASPNTWFAAGVLVLFLMVPLFGWFLWESWKDAKWEIERENHQMLHDIKKDA
tara:strand:- start:2710 stop:2955 length:246 start_codon:yes stop_codon:yes gene_type:complete